MRLIDADALKEEIWVRPIALKDFQKSIVQTVIDNASAIDAVSVVRCKECKYGKYEFVDNKDWIYCKHHYDYWTADDFCSYGEREGE